MAETSSATESVKIGRYKLPLPRSRLLRIIIGVLLILGGVFAILPVFGIWMLPFGLLVLSVDIPRVRRWRRRFAVWFTRRYPNLAARFNPAKDVDAGKLEDAGKPGDDPGKQGHGPHTKEAA